jgi:hypothetical protein
MAKIVPGEMRGAIRQKETTAMNLLIAAILLCFVVEGITIAQGG